MGGTMDRFKSPEKGDANNNFRIGAKVSLPTFNSYGSQATKTSFTSPKTFNRRFAN